MPIRHFRHMSRDPHFEQMLAQVAWPCGAIFHGSSLPTWLDKALQKSLPFVTSCASVDQSCIVLHHVLNSEVISFTLLINITRKELLSCFPTTYQHNLLSLPPNHFVYQKTSKRKPPALGSLFHNYKPPNSCCQTPPP